MTAALLVARQLTGTFESMVTVAWNAPNRAKELLTMRRAVQWTREGASKDDLVVEISTPPVVQHERVFVARIAVRNLSLTTTRRLVLSIDPITNGVPLRKMLKKMLVSGALTHDRDRNWMPRPSTPVTSPNRQMKRREAKRKRKSKKIDGQSQKVNMKDNKEYDGQQEEPELKLGQKQEQEQERNHSLDDDVANAGETSFSTYAAKCIVDESGTVGVCRCNIIIYQHGILVITPMEKSTSSSVSFTIRTLVHWQANDAGTQIKVTTPSGLLHFDTENSCAIDSELHRVASELLSRKLTSYATKSIPPPPPPLPPPPPPRQNPPPLPLRSQSPQPSAPLNDETNVSAQLQGRKQTLNQNSHSNIQLICLQSSVRLSDLRPNTSCYLTLHMLPLRRGNIQIDTLKMVDIDSGEIYALRQPCPVSAMGEEELRNGERRQFDHGNFVNTDKTKTPSSSPTTKMRSEQEEDVVQQIMERRKSRSSFSMDEVHVEDKTIKR